MSDPQRLTPEESPIAMAKTRRRSALRVNIAISSRTLEALILLALVMVILVRVLGFLREGPQEAESGEASKASSQVVPDLGEGMRDLGAGDA